MQVTVVAAGAQHTFTLKNIATDLKAHLIVLDCPWCHANFVPTRPHQIFCSNACRWTHWRKGTRKSA